MNLASVTVQHDDVDILLSAKQYQQRLLALIAQAKQRIYITALYLEDDQAGRLVFDALYQAKQKNPQLDVCVFVDAHRAQRGLIGQAEKEGNRAMYREYAQKYAHSIHVYGVAVKPKEFLGVLHLKGMVFDDIVLYSGASINNVYLHHQEKYRLDRYYQLRSAELAESFCQYLQQQLIETSVAIDLSAEHIPSLKQQRIITKSTKTLVKRGRYFLPAQDNKNEKDGLQISPLVGCGKRNNQLNQVICQLIKESSSTIIIFTPYFNLPRAVTKQLVAALKRGVKITIIVGDKTANDFFISEEEKFSTIGIIPYIYEQILLRFVKRWQSFINSEQLNIKLWQDGANSYHLKGLVVDSKYHLLTGSNLNPRAWGLDLENGVLIKDTQQHLLAGFEQELAAICVNTNNIKHFKDIESLEQYPLRPRKLLRRLKLSKFDRVLKRFL